MVKAHHRVFGDSPNYSPGVIGFNLEQISNKLKISGSVQKNALNNISKVPYKNPPGGNAEIQDGGQNGRRF